MLDHRSHVHSNLLDKYCRFCKQTFSVKANLIEHMKRVHNSDDISKAHIKMKNGDSIFIVAEDIKDFSDTFASQETTLPKQYSCITCKKSFQTKELAERHAITCNFCCDICQKGFKRKRTLTKHIKTIHKQNTIWISI